MRERLQGKVALVSGGGRRIGEAVARLFAQHGACVVVGQRREAERQRAAEAIRDDGGEGTRALDERSPTATEKGTASWGMKQFPAQHLAELAAVYASSLRNRRTSLGAQRVQAPAGGRQLILADYAPHFVQVDFFQASRIQTASCRSGARGASRRARKRPCGCPRPGRSPPPARGSCTAACRVRPADHILAWHLSPLQQGDGNGCQGIRLLTPDGPWLSRRTRDKNDGDHWSRVWSGRLLV